jgi:putative hydrolase of the HAD superfamily
MAAVIFDLDDTLYPQAQFVHSGFAAVARFVHAEGGPAAEDVYAALRIARDSGHRGREFQRLLERCGLDAAMLPDLVRVYRGHAPQLWLSHGARAVLDTLRGNGWRTALLTNGIPSVQAAKVAVLGLNDLVDHVVYAGEHADGGKPAPEPFLEALRRLQAAPGEAVMVGDDPANDIDGASAVGIRTIFMARAGGERPPRADAVVRLLTDVPPIAAELVARGFAHAA